MVEGIRQDIYGVSEQFVDEFQDILEKYYNDQMIISYILESVVSEISLLRKVYSYNI